MLNVQRYRNSLGIGTNPPERLFLLISGPTTNKNTLSWNYNKDISIWISSLPASAQAVRIGMRVWYGEGADLFGGSTLFDGDSRDVTSDEIGLDQGYVNVVPFGEVGFTVKLDPSNAPGDNPYPVAIEFYNKDVPVGGTGRVSIDAASLGDLTWMSGIGTSGMPPSINANYSDPGAVWEGLVDETQVVTGLTDGGEIRVHTDADLTVAFYFPLAEAYGTPIAVTAPGDIISAGGAQAIITTATTANVRIF